MTTEDKTFTLFWLHGDRQVVIGPTIEQACMNAGLGRGAIRALAWYDYGDVETHTWDKQQKIWVLNDHWYLTKFFSEMRRSNSLFWIQKHLIPNTLSNFPFSQIIDKPEHAKIKEIISSLESTRSLDECHLAAAEYLGDTESVDSIREHLKKRKKTFDLIQPD